MEEMHKDGMDGKLIFFFTHCQTISQDCEMNDENFVCGGAAVGHMIFSALCFAEGDTVAV